MEKYSHRERILMILAGEKPDRFAASFWRHFFHREHDAEGTAEAMLWFQKKFDWDFMKINPRADYHVQDWGVKLEYSKEEFKKHTKVCFPIKTIDDWATIKPLRTSAPVLAEHLKLVSLISKQSDRELPLLMTVFTPLSIAGRLVEKHETLVGHLRSHPDIVHHALRAITNTFSNFISELRNAGADGIFFATTHWASSDLLTWDEYKTFGVPYDLEVMKAAETDAVNLFHVCGSNNYLKQLISLDYPAMMINWDSSDPTNVPLDKAVDCISGKVLVGGVDHQGWLQKSQPDEIMYFIDKLKQNYDSSQLIIAPGCVVEPETNLKNLEAIRSRL